MTTSPKDQVIHHRVTAEFKKRLIAEAEKEERTLSDYITRTLAKVLETKKE